jgi:hypothetical protein
MGLTPRPNPTHAPAPAPDAIGLAAPTPLRPLAGQGSLPFMHPIAWDVLLELTPSLRAP